MHKRHLFFAFVFFFLISHCVRQEPVDEAAIKTAIRSVMDDQVKGWNAGDAEKFMAGYLQSETLRFVSGGDVNYGWQTTLDRYRKRYPGKAAMGTLTFSEVDITVLSGEAAIVFGKWALERENDAPWGYYTLLFRKTEDGWRVVHDHTSSAETE